MAGAHSSRSTILIQFYGKENVYIFSGKYLSSTSVKLNIAMNTLGLGLLNFVDLARWRFTVAMRTEVSPAVE
jgi:hypothetical protein